MKHEYYDFFYRWLCGLINDYCDRHGYILMEIDWEDKEVYYYKEGTNMFEDYTNFNYLKVNLYK